MNMPRAPIRAIGIVLSVNGTLRCFVCPAGDAQPGDAAADAIMTDAEVAARHTLPTWP